MNLMTPYEAVRYSPVQKDYPTEYVCRHIGSIEKRLFRACYLGIELYAAMIADLKDLSNVVEYEESTEYSLDDLVLYLGVIYQSKKDNNTDPISEWDVVDKFAAPKYNTLWNDYMAEWLAYNIMHKSIKYSTYQAGAQGLVKLVEDDTGMQTVNYKEFSTFKAQLKYDADEILEGMYEYMVDEGLITASECGSECAKPQPERRIYWKT